MLEKPAAFGY